MIFLLKDKAMINRMSIISFRKSAKNVIEKVVSSLYH